MEASEQVVEAIKKAAVVRDGRQTLGCVDAFATAERFGVKLAVIGRLCNEHGVKIVQCQLGCFK